MKKCLVVNLGLIEYGAAWDLQRQLVAARKNDIIPDVVLLCEHPHVITLGRNGKLAHLRASNHVLQQMGVTFFETDRGGDITYHGPGQLVGYPILNLAEIRRDVAWYVRNLEEAMMGATADFGIAPRRVNGCTGVWIDVPIGSHDGTAPEASTEVPAGAASSANAMLTASSDNATLTASTETQKLAAIGVHLSRWVTSHGFAYNVSTDLRYFDLIVPCGIAGKRATSLEQRLNRRVEMSDVAPRIVERLGKLFGLAMRDSDRADLDELLQTHEEHPAVVTS